MANRNQYPYSSGYTGSGRGYPAGNTRSSSQASQVGYRPQGQQRPPVRQAPPPRQQQPQQRPGYGQQARRPAMPPPQQQPRYDYEAPREPAARSRKDLILLAVMLFGIPLTGIIGMFFTPFMWVMAIICFVCMAAIALSRGYTTKVRIIICSVLAVLAILAIVVAVDSAPKQGDYPTYSNGTDNTVQDTLTQQQANNPAFAGFATDPTPTAPIEMGEDGGGEGNAGALMAYNEAGELVPAGAEGDMTQMSGQMMTSDTGAPANAAVDGAQAALTNYLEQWKERDFEEMARYTLQSWRNSVAVPHQQLYWNHNWWILNSWTMNTQTTSPSADSVTFTVIADLSKSNSTKTPARMEYSALVFKENGSWFVDPDSMRSGIAIVDNSVADTAQQEGQTQVTQQEEGGVPSNAVLWYNSKGGKYYHLEEKCSSISSDYYGNMKSFTYAELGDKTYKNLVPCGTCSAPARPK